MAGSTSFDRQMQRKRERGNHTPSPRILRPPKVAYGVVWTVACINNRYRCEVLGPAHIKPGYCPACGGPATAAIKE
jgi:hypothetical protein